MGWVDVLNEALEWEDEPGRMELRRRFGPAPIDFDALAESVATLRGAVASTLLGPQVPVPAAVSQWLAAVTLEIAPSISVASPALRVARRDSKLPLALEQLLSTALVQWAASETTSAVRCAGLVAAARPVWDPMLDTLFARKAGLSSGPPRDRIQCPQLVDGPRAGRFCSKACSNAAFATRKAERDPDYFARKQARYRDGKRRAAARVEQAFAFVD